jgi:CRP/FNR family cyclic AMP-dependent transcriptional regulator
VIFKDGDAPDKMYVVISGVVEIHLRDAVIETVPQGGTFGEMALIDSSPRSATVIDPASKGPLQFLAKKRGGWG